MVRGKRVSFASLPRRFAYHPQERGLFGNRDRQSPVGLAWARRKTAPQALLVQRKFEVEPDTTGLCSGDAACDILKTYPQGRPITHWRSGAKGFAVF